MPHTKDPEGVGLTTDGNNNFYITGYTSSLKGIATAGAYQTIFSSCFAAKFSQAGKLNWATYYGGKSSTMGYAIAADSNSNIYFTGLTESMGGIATSSAYQSSYGGGPFDFFLAKLPVPHPYFDAGIASISSPATAICPGTKKILVQLKDYGANTLTTLDIGWKINGTTKTNYTWTGSLKMDSIATVNLGNINFNAGKDTISAWTSKPNGEPDSAMDNDSVKKIISSIPLPNAHWTASLLNSVVKFIPVDSMAKSYFWRFGNGDSSYAKSPVDTYKTIGGF